DELRAPLGIVRSAEGSEVIEERLAGQAFVEAHLARKEPDLVLDTRRLSPAIEAEHASRALRRAQQSHELSDGGRLPGPVRTEEGEDLALVDVEREVEHATPTAVIAREVFDFDRDRHAPEYGEPPLAEPRTALLAEAYAPTPRT